MPSTYTTPALDPHARRDDGNPGRQLPRHETSSMTTAPKYPLQHAHMGDENPFDIVDSAWGSIERWRAQALETGSLGALTALSKKVRNDSAGIAARHDAREDALNSRQDALDQRERNLGVLAAQVTDFVGKASVLFDRIQRLKADAEEEPLPLPPGLTSELPDPALNEPATNADTAEGDPPDLDERGEFLRLSHPVTRDQAEPAGGKEFPDPELPHPPIVQSPIAAGLDEK